MATALPTLTLSRYTDLQDEPVTKLLVPVKGYENELLLPLEKAVVPIQHIFIDLEEHVYIAKHNCQEKEDDLTQDERAAVYLYTMQFSSGESLYTEFNKTLRSERRDSLIPWFRYLKLFLTALFKLKSIRATVWRGVRGADLSKKYKTGTKFTWWGVSSCTTALDVLETSNFLGKTGVRTVFSIECENGKSIVKHSYFSDSEKEIILMPGTYFEVMGQANPAEGLHIIHLKEIQPPFPMIKPPFPQKQQQQQQHTHVPPLRASSTDIHPNARWKQNGLTVAGGNGKGNGINQLCWPYGLYVDDDQTTVVADTSNHRIVEWKSGATSGRVVAGGHGEGNGAHQLSCPTDVIVDKQTDSLIICDRGNKRVVRWPRRNGTSREIIISNIDCVGLTMDENGSLYVTDEGRHEVRRYRRGESQGTIVAGGNGKGNRLDQLSGPQYVFVDGDHSVYVSEQGNHRVMKWMEGAKEGIVVAGGQGQGNGLTQLNGPVGVVVDQRGTVYVADCANHRIMRWVKGSKEGSVIVGGNGKGEQSNQLNYPAGLSFDRHGNLYVVDWGNHRVQNFNIE